MTCNSLARFAFALLLFAAPVHAESAADLETARLLFREGNDLREKGDLRAALAKYKSAHAIVYTPITGLEVGRTHLALGELVEARETLLAVGRLPVRAQESKNAAAARIEAERLATEIAPRIPTLHITVVGGIGVTLSLDGQALPSSSADEARKVNPGKHHLLAHATGMKDASADLELAEREEKSITLKLEPLPLKREPPPPPPVVTVERHTSPLVYIGFGVAAAAAVTGAVTGSLALSRASSLHCPDGRCGPSEHDDLRATRTLGAVSTVSFIVAGGAAVASVIGLWSSPVVETRSGVTARVELGVGSVLFSGSFL